MARIKTESLQEGMEVSQEVKNSDGMLILPEGCVLTARLINMLQSWSIPSVEVKVTGSESVEDPLLKLTPEQLEKLQTEVKATFWKSSDSDPVCVELQRVIVRRRASQIVANK